MHYFSLYLEFIKIKIQSVAQYRNSFILGVLSQFVMYGAQFLMIWIIINKFQNINGWLPEEILLLYGLNLGTYALAGFFFNSVTSQLPNMIKNGTFDEVLTKPVNSLIYLVCRDFNSGYISHLSLSALVIAIALSRLHISLSAPDIMFFILVSVGGMLIQSGALLLTAIPSFWLISNSGLQSILFFQMTEFIRYPISIYHKVIQFILTFILPYSFINFYPAQYFLNKQDQVLFHSSFQYLTPIVGLIIFIVACLAWRLGIKNYTSTGS